MGRFNEFLVDMLCPTCHATPREASEALLRRVGVTASPDGAVRFQARAGVPLYDEFRLGDRVLRDDAAAGSFEPSGARPGQDFWVAGVATCGRCQVQLWARVEIRRGIFSALELTAAPKEALAWGVLGVEDASGNSGDEGR